MAVYDGFFDAVLNEETGEYDRSYNSGDFTAYFEKLIGSGVCIHKNQDSFKVRFENGAAAVSPGYLFIQGYWLKNDADYTIPVTGTATLAIAAHLNLGKRMIELEAVSVAQAYPDSLVLALVNPAAGTAEDTRHNTDICGVIDSAGELSKKVEWAVNYIDNEVEARLAAAEADIAEKSRQIDAKIAEAQAAVDNITPPPVGTIQFSASQNVGPEWLRCDGSFINEADYPELVAALGKLTPSGDKFKLLSDGEIPQQISNGAVYAGRLWVYSYSAKKLYGVDLNGSEPVKEIPVTCEDANFNNFLPPSTARPLVLSIVPHIVGTGVVLFLSQIFADHRYQPAISDLDWKNGLLIFSAPFTGDETSLSVSLPFSATSVSWTGDESKRYIKFNGNEFLPKIVSFGENGAEVYYCSIGTTSLQYEEDRVASMKWKQGEPATFYKTNLEATSFNPYQRCAYDSRANSEMVYVDYDQTGTEQQYFNIASIPSGSFVAWSYLGSNIQLRNTYGPCNVAGRDAVLLSFDKDKITRTILSTKITKTIPISSLPSAAHVFVDAAVYLWGKDMYMIFVGTGIVFSRTLEEGSFGYLDTTSVLGTITQFGYLDYSQDEGTLYLLGQDTSNRVKVAKIVLNTLYDYANDGAWLPLLASDGVPAYIKAKEE